MNPNDKKARSAGILIVEDSPSQAAALRYLLEEHGYAVTSAGDGEQALTQARRSPPALIVSDVLMPNMDGFTLCAEIRRDDQLKHVPVILLTALSDLRDIVKGLECGAEQFIRKPYDERYLLERIDFLLTSPGRPATARVASGVEIRIDGKTHCVLADPQQIVEMLVSVYTAATQLGEDLKQREQELEQSNQALAQRNFELLENAEQLRQANRELGTFNQTVSHDLRAPLRHIEGYARLLAEDAGVALKPETHRYVRTIVESVQHMNQLINGLLEFSRLGRQPIARQAVDMQALAESVLAELRENTSTGNGAAQIEVAPLPAAGGDPVLLRQVWANLLSNALKYSAARGDQARIEVAGERRGDRLHYSVTDNGAGFDMRYADKLFGVFQRLHREDQFEGAGVGLAIVQRIINRHGGRVSATGEVDRGACFSFELPIQDVMS